MAVDVKPGTRLCSTTCDTEVVVVKSPGGSADVRCGGAPMVAAGEARDGGIPVAPFDTGTLAGKRYTCDDESLELLCTRPGAGGLSLGEDALFEKGAKPLPSSD